MHSKSLEILFHSNDSMVLHELIYLCWLNAIRTVNRNVLTLEQKQFITTPKVNPKILLMYNETPSEYFSLLTEHVKPYELMIVSHHDHENFIRQHYPDSIIIIHAKKKPAYEIAKLVMDKITPFIERKQNNHSLS